MLFSVILDLLVSVRKLVKMLSYENNFLDKLIFLAPIIIFNKNFIDFWFASWESEKLP